MENLYKGKQQFRNESEEGEMETSCLLSLLKVASLPHSLRLGIQQKVRARSRYVWWPQLRWFELEVSLSHSSRMRVSSVLRSLP